MYHDRANVFRAVHTKIGKSDDFTEEYRLVYEDVPCHLAQYGKELSAHRDDTTMHLTTNLRLDHDPAFEILENDTVYVLREGIVTRYFAGETFRYSSHAETVLLRRREARQK